MNSPPSWRVREPVLRTLLSMWSTFAMMLFPFG
jgi:hypothetical protein